MWARSQDPSSPHGTRTSVLIPIFREKNGLEVAHPALAEPGHLRPFLPHLSMAPQCLRNLGKGCDGRQDEMKSPTCSPNDKESLSITRIPFKAMEPPFPHTHGLPAVPANYLSNKGGVSSGGGCPVRARLPRIPVVPLAQDKLLPLIQFLPPSPPPFLAS